jgi:serine/threonine protein kinase
MTEPKTGDRVSEYLLDELVGRGTFGQVWKAHHHVWKDEVVAVKVPTDSQYVRNLQKEGLAVHGLRHPNIVRALGFDPYGDTPYLVMEYVDGMSLRKLISDHCPRGMPVPAVERITKGILRALEHAHANGVIHRDIKPENVLIKGVRPESGAGAAVDGIGIDDARVTDFGLGRAGQVTAESILQSGSQNARDSIAGTVAYMAPEVRDRGETDARSDLYSVSVVLFEMLCGERPSGIDLPSQMREGLPAWVDRVYSRLSTRHDRRFATATEALRAIESAPEPPRARPAVGPPVARTHEPPVAQPRKTASERECPTCSAPTESDDNFCIKCGAQLVANPRRCLLCGGYAAREDRYCLLCGAQLPARLE